MNKAKNDSIFNLTLRLVIITVCAGLILGLVYGITKGPDVYKRQVLIYTISVMQTQ